MVQGSVETEVKIRIPSKFATAETLLKAGFLIAKSRRFEANILLDRSHGPSLREAGMLLRLRQAGEQCKITWKGPATQGAHKSRPEIETGVESSDVLEKIMEHIGFVRTFRYEKYRTEYESHTEPGGTVTVDETPIGEFLELEGPGDWIDRIASKLGFSHDDYVLGSYGSLYQAWCAEHGITPTNMVFSA